MQPQQKKTKNKFNFDNILSLNRDLNLSSKKEIDKWFKLVSEHTGMIYSPADEKEYAKLTQRFSSNSCVFFWFNEVIDELKKINNGIKQYYIDKKKRELLKDFQ